MTKRKPLQNILVNGKRYDLVVLKVTGRDEKGRPRECIVGFDDTTFYLEGGEEFLTAFIPASAGKPHN